MAQYIVSSLNAQESPRGTVLDRIVGPGWASTTENMLNHLMRNQHQFILADTNLQLAARRQGRDRWQLIIVDPDGRQVAPESLPHWRVEQMRPAPGPHRNWWQRLLDPDAA